MNDFRQQLKPMTPASSALLETMQKASAEVNEIAQKEFKIRKHRANLQSKAIDEDAELLEATKNVRLDIIDPEYFANLAVENTTYFEYAQNCPDFLNPDFRDMVPFFARNLIFIGAESGNGKSTIAGNVAFHTIRQNKNVLILTNEEIDSDVYNRVTCLVKGWGYTNHRYFTRDQIDVFNQMYPVLGQRLTVVSDKYNGRSGTTTTFEGIKSILDSLLTTQKKYDVIVIDYFQNISTSLEDRNSPEWKILDKVCKYLDNFRKLYNAPIILLGQMKPSNGEDTAPYKERIERCKAIYNVATCCLEVKADVENSRTEFICHKSRFTKGIGQKIFAGFDKGKYIQHDAIFANKLLVTQQQNANKKMLEDTMKARIDLEE